MKVKCIKDYFDLEMNRAVKALEEFEVTAARGRELASAKNKAGFPLVEIIEAPKKKTAKKTEDK